jgi:hypothetical protein
MLTLIVNTNVNALLTGTEHVGAIGNGSDASGGGRLSLQLVNLALIPAFAFTVAIFLDNVIGVKVVYANLPTCRQTAYRIHVRGLLTSLPALYVMEARGVSSTGLKVRCSLVQMPSRCLLCSMWPFSNW